MQTGKGRDHVRKDYNSFIDSIESKNTAKIARSLSIIGEYNYDDIIPPVIEHIVLETKPNSPKDITTVLYIMSLYAKYIGNDDMYYMIRGIDRKLLWVKAKPMAKDKFISNKEFIYICDDIIKHEEHNAKYLQVLFRCVYDGIYSDDMSVLKNLRKSDINGDIVTLRYDSGYTHNIEVSSELAEDLKELSANVHWWRNNRYGSYKIDVSGKYKDSCFKVENRNGSDDYSYRYSYYRTLRKISKEYIGRHITPLQLYVSGIMHRISTQLNSYDINLEDAFADNNKDRLVGKIISDELKRTGYSVEVRNFREMVKGHLDIFCI